MTGVSIMLAMLTGLGAMAAIDLLARAGTIALLTLMGSCSYATVSARLKWATCALIVVVASHLIVCAAH